MSYPYEKHPSADKHRMRATEVLKRYAVGRRDFSGENLRGQSFKGKNLSGANFSGADIRGANFTNAKLIGVNFSRAKAGLQRRWAIGVVIVSWIFSGLSAIFCVLTVEFLILFLLASADSKTSIWDSLIVFAVFFIVAVRQGLLASFVAVAGVLTVVVVVPASLAIFVPGEFFGTFFFDLTQINALHGTITVTTAFASTGMIATAIAHFFGL